ISLFHATHRLHAFDTIEVTKAALVKALQRHSPSALPEFDTLFKRYEQIVFDFFDTDNLDPLSVHLHRMEQELITLDQICTDIQFYSIIPTLRIYQQHLKELVALLHTYRGVRDIIPLGFKVRKFKFLLPETLQQRGDIALFFALHHRLTCGT
ncbi:MAG: hypothetical protein ACHQVS_04765, partial [Candidatus Babeliales bacterium]